MRTTILGQDSSTMHSSPSSPASLECGGHFWLFLEACRGFRPPARQIALGSGDHGGTEGPLGGYASSRLPGCGNHGSSPSWSRKPSRVPRMVTERDRITGWCSRRLGQRTSMDKRLHLTTEHLSCTIWDRQPPLPHREASCARRRA